MQGLVAIIALVRDKNIGIQVFANLDNAEIRHAIIYKILIYYYSMIIQETGIRKYMICIRKGEMTINYHILTLLKIEMLILNYL